MTNRLLVVDRNPRDLRVIEVSSRVAGYDVQTATSLEAASAVVLGQAPPDLLIAADDSPEFDAFALCERLKANPGSRDLPILILLQNFTQQGRLRAIAAGADDALAKPISTAEVLHRTHALCRRRGRDRLLSSNTPGPGERNGNLADVPTVDLLAIIETWGRSGILHLRTTAGAEAAIYIRGGKPVDAEAGGVSGMAALARIFSWETGTYRIELKNIRRADVLPGSMSDLVMAGMSDRNAWETELRNGIDRSSILEVNAAVLAEHLAGMTAECNGLLRLCDGERSVRSVIDASALSDDEALKELTEMLARGILRPVAVLASHASSMATDSMAESAGGDDEPHTMADGTAAPFAGLPAQESSAHEVGDQDVLGERSPRQAIVPPSPPPQPATSSASSEHTTSAEMARPAPVPLEPSGAMPSRLEGALLDEHEEEFASPSAAASTPPHSDAAPGDAVAPPSATSSSMNATLPHGLAETQVPEHFRALILETSAGEVSAGAVTDPTLVPLVRVAASREPEDGETAAIAVPVTAKSTLPASEPDPHVPAGDAVLATTDRKPSGPSNDDFPDGYTDEQALEELGLSGRGRRLKWSAGAVAAVALAAFGARHWFAQHHAEAVTPGQPTALATKPEPAGLPLPPAGEVPPPLAPVVTPPGARVVAPMPLELPGSVAQKPATAAGKAASVHAEDAEKRALEAVREEPRRDPAPALAEEPSARPALAACRKAAEKHGRHRSAKACEEAVSANPRSAEALTLLAHVEMKRGRMKRAQELATKASEIDPTMADAYAILGGVLQDSGRDHEAKSAYRKYLRLAPNGRYAGELRSIVGTM